MQNEPDNRGRSEMKLQMGKGRRGITPCGGCSTIELLPHLVEQAGLEPTTDDNPQLRPIKIMERKVQPRQD